MAAVVAWRYSGPHLKKAALALSILLSVALGVWFGYLTFVGSELAESVFDRVMNAAGVIIGAINLPILQVLAALVLLFAWPRRWVFKGFSDHQEADPIAEAIAEPIGKIDAGTPVV